MNSVVIVAGIVFVPENLMSEELVAYHRGDCSGLAEEAQDMGYKFEICLIETDIYKYTLKKDYSL